MESRFRYDEKIAVLLGALLVVATLTSCGGSRERAERKQFQRELAEVKKEVAAERTEPSAGQGSGQGTTSPAIQVPRESRLLELQRIASQYELALSSGGGTESERLSAQRRLADLNVELERERFLRAMEDYESQVANGTAGDPPRQNYARAISQYRTLLSYGKRVPDRDQLFYQLAFCQAQMGERREAIQAMEQLVRESPRSPYLQEIYFRLGEEAFEDDQLSVARQYYRKGLERSEEGLYALNSRYKLGWTEFLQANYGAAADTFASLLDRLTPEGDGSVDTGSLPQRPSASAEAGKGLYGDALLMLTRCFTEQSSTLSLEKQFQAWGVRPYRGDVYRLAAEIWSKEDQVEVSQRAFQTYLSLRPLDVHAPEAFRGQIEMLERTRDFARAAQVREKAVEVFAPSSPWMANQSDQPEMAASGELLARDSLRALARYHHHVGQKEKTATSFSKAISHYERYLSLYSKAADADEILYLKAEAFFESGSALEAGRTFASLGTRFPQSKRRTKAILESFATFEVMGQQLLKLNQSPKPAWQELEAIRPLAREVLGNQPERADLLFREGAHWYQSKEWTKCRAPLEEFLRAYPNHAKVFSAARFIALSLHEEGRYADAVKALERALAIRTNSENAAEIQERSDLQELRALDMLRLAKTPEDLLAVSKAQPRSKAGAQALFDAARGFLEKGKVDAGVSALGQFVAQYPGDPNRFPAIAMLADVERTRKRYPEAAGYFRQAADLSQKEGAGQSDSKDRKLWQDRRADALLQLARTWEQAGKRDRSVAAYREILQAGLLGVLETGARSEVRFHVARADFDGTPTQKKAAKKDLSDLIAACGKERGTEKAYFAGQAQLVLAREDQREFLKIKLVPPFAKNLKEKTRRMDRTVKSLGQAIDYRDAETVTEASYRLGEVLESFARALRDSPIPREFSGEDRERYRLALEEKAFPFEERARSAYESVLEAGRDAKLDNRWTRKAIKTLKRMAPGQYAKQEVPPVLPPKGEFF